MEIIILV